MRLCVEPQILGPSSSPKCTTLRSPNTIYFVKKFWSVTFMNMGAIEGGREKGGVITLRYFQVLCKGVALTTTIHVQRRCSFKSFQKATCQPPTTQILFRIRADWVFY